MNQTQVLRWLEKYSWKIGVYIVLFWALVLAMVAANEVLTDVHPMGLKLMNYTINAGLLLMTVSLLLPALEWSYQQIIRPALAMMNHQ